MGDNGASQGDGAPRILLVDEELVTSTLGPELARRLPALVTATHDLQEARELLEDGSFDLLLVADRAGGGDGARFLSEVRTTSKAARVLLATEARPVSDADAVILKPYNLRWVTRALTALLRNEQPPRQRRPGRGWRPPLA